MSLTNPLILGRLFLGGNRDIVGGGPMNNFHEKESTLRILTPQKCLVCTPAKNRFIHPSNWRLEGPWGFLGYLIITHRGGPFSRLQPDPRRP